MAARVGHSYLFVAGLLLAVGLLATSVAAPLVLAKADSPVASPHTQPPLTPSGAFDSPPAAPLNPSPSPGVSPSNPAQECFESEVWGLLRFQMITF